MNLSSPAALSPSAYPVAHPVAHLGQVFTRDDVVGRMLALCRNRGRVLEPSAGEGAFSSRLPGCVAVELDETIAPEGAWVGDFFSYPLTERFDTIIGNPPYVRHQDILPATKRLLDSDLFDGRSNLYLYFIEKCIRHLNPGGELVFITPRDFIKLTAARQLNAWLASQGSVTDFVETGDSDIFGDYVPNCAIWRFEKGKGNDRMSDGRRFVESNGQLLFLHGDYTIPFGDLFDVKVGAVSGADDLFTSAAGNLDFVCSTTIDDGRVRRMIYNQKHPSLEAHRERLLNRKVKRFSEKNWWTWGRSHHQSPKPRIYVNGKTRRPQPFFLHDCKDYDGSILALFPKDPAMDMEKAVTLLNTAVDWADLGFVCDGRYLFAQRSLQHCWLPACFGALRK